MLRERICGLIDTKARYVPAPSPPPANDDVEDAIDLGVISNLDTISSTTGTQTGATLQLASGSILATDEDSGNGTKSTWYKFQVDLAFLRDGSDVTFAFNSKDATDAAFYQWKDLSGSITYIPRTTADPFVIPRFYDGNTALDDINIDFYLQIQGDDEGAFDFSLTANGNTPNTPPSNDDYGNATDLGTFDSTVSLASITGTLDGATTESLEDYAQGLRSVWWKFQVDSDYLANVTSLDITYTTIPGGASFHFWEDNGGMSEITSGSSLNLTSAEINSTGRDYYISVQGNDEGAIDFSVIANV